MSTKRKPPATLARPVLQKNAKMPVKTRIDESNTIVSKAESMQPTPRSDIIEIPSDSSSHYSDILDSEEGESEDDDDEKDDRLGARSAQQQPTPPETVRPPPNYTGDVRSSKRRDAHDSDADDDEDDQEGDSPPTFGELVRTSEVIDVPTSLRATGNRPPTTALAAPQHGHLHNPTTLTSLGTVLNQALRTDDAALLDTCLNTADLPTVRATIQRMDASLASALLAKLAARMHRRPGRAHSLMSWVQWTLVAHGGALAVQPDMSARLADLSRVLDERARGLTSLLALKGKLDMLEAQMQLRRENRASAAASRRMESEGGKYGRRARGIGLGSDAELDDGDDEDEDEEGVVYVEGEEDDEDEGVAVNTLPNGSSSRRRRTGGGGAAASDEDELDGIPLINGTGADSEQDDDEEGASEQGDMAVDDKDLAGDASLDEDEIDFDDVDDESDDDEEEDDSEAEVAAPPPKKLKPASSKRK